MGWKNAGRVTVGVGKAQSQLQGCRTGQCCPPEAQEGGMEKLGESGGRFHSGRQ